MLLVVHLVGRLLDVVLLCFAGASGWVVIDAHQPIEAETAATAKRLGQGLERLYWQKLLWRGGMSKDSLLPMRDWETLATASVISPGVCVTFAPTNDDSRQMCSQIEAFGRPAPARFAEAALGGSLSIGKAAGGVRIAATIPLG